MTISVDFHPNLSSDDVERSVSELDERLRQVDPVVRRVFIEAQSWLAHKRIARQEGT